MKISELWKSDKKRRATVAPNAGLLSRKNGCVARMAGSQEASSGAAKAGLA
jgi:hypothetical protein